MVQRYSFIGGPYAYADPDDKGDWVSSEDFASLEKRCAEAEAMKEQWFKEWHDSDNALTKAELRCEEAERERDGYKNGQEQIQDISDCLFRSNNALGAKVKALLADNALLRKRLEQYRQFWEWSRLVDKYNFCTDSTIEFEKMELKEAE